MDDQLITKIREMRGSAEDAAGNTDVDVQLTDADGNIELGRGDQKAQYKLKPLKELYGSGRGGAPVSMQEKAFMPLLLTIEEEIVRFDNAQSRLTDAGVRLALQQLSMSPEAPSADPLARNIQLSLRLNLSLNNFSRQEVRQAIRQVGKSVDRHEDGRRGYLEFVKEFLTGR